MYKRLIIKFTEVIIMPKERPKREFRVINIRPRLSKEEVREYMERVAMPVLVKLGMYKEVSADYEPKPIIEIPLDELGEGETIEKLKQFLRDNPNYMAYK